jgi:teichuronic acid biosynthesis glycosyltransferase TuaC
MKTDKKTIVWLTTQFPNGNKNRNGIFIYRTVKFLSEYYDIHVLNLYSRTPPYLVMLKNFSEAGKIYKEWQERFPSRPVKPEGSDSFRVKYTKYFRLPRGRLDYLEKYFVYSKVRTYAEKLISKGKNDVIIHSNWLFPESSVALKLQKELGLKFVVSLRGGDIRELLRGSNNYFEAKEILQNAEKIGMVTKESLEDAKKIGLLIKDEKIRTLNNFYDVSRFVIKERDETKKLLGISTDFKAIFYAGTLRELKNIGSLIKALKEVKKRFGSIKLFIAGSGIEDKKLKNTADELDLKDDVVFLGNIDTDTMIDYYNASDVFCLPSFSEGLPNVCVESLLCGTPVAASRVNGVPDIIFDEQNGFMFDPNSVKDIKEKLILILEKEWDREKLRTSVSEFMPENILKSYKEFYAL